jgi:hypothetical protein
MRSIGQYILVRAAGSIVIPARFAAATCNAYVKAGNLSVSGPVHCCDEVEVWLVIDGAVCSENSRMAASVAKWRQ